MAGGKILRFQKRELASFVHGNRHVGFCVIATLEVIIIHMVTSLP
jgi:hypothetical protein